MDNIGKLIMELRKEKGMTQQELGDILGVSPKTISKWECNNGLPDVNILNKISSVFEISVDELLKGKRNKKKKFNKRKYILIILVILLIIGLILFIKNTDNKKNNVVNKEEKVKDYPCTMVSNYFVHLIFKSNDENYKYITITQFQTEGIYSVIVPTVIADKLEKEKRYKFTFKTKEDYKNVSPAVLFANSEIVNVEESGENDLGSTYTCP